MKKMILLSVLLIFLVFASGCTSKDVPQDTTPEPPPTLPDDSAADVDLPADEIPLVDQSGGIDIEEPEFDIDTNVDLGSLI